MAVLCYKSIPSLTARRFRRRYVKQMETERRFSTLSQSESDSTAVVPLARVPLSTLKRVATASARYLLGFLMTMGGFNGFLHFANHPLPIPLLAKQYMEALLNSHYMMGVAFVEGVAGILLLANRYVALALTILAAILFNILLYHATLETEGTGAAIVVSLLWVIVFVRHRTAFRELLRGIP